MTPELDPDPPPGGPTLPPAGASPLRRAVRRWQARQDSAAAQQKQLPKTGVFICCFCRDLSDTQWPALASAYRRGETQFRYYTHSREVHAHPRLHGHDQLRAPVLHPYVCGSQHCHKWRTHHPEQRKGTGTLVRKCRSEIASSFDVWCACFLHRSGVCTRGTMDVHQVCSVYPGQIRQAILLACTEGTTCVREEQGVPCEASEPPLQVSVVASAVSAARGRSHVLIIPLSGALLHYKGVKQ
jgi:hypothetical protein